MSTTTRVASLRVINDNVDLGKGKSLPRGDYAGTIATAQISIRGRPAEQIVKVSIYLSEQFLAQVFGDRPNSSRAGIDADFTSYFKAGDIIEA